MAIRKHWIIIIANVANNYLFWQDNVKSFKRSRGIPYWTFRVRKWAFYLHKKKRKNENYEIILNDLTNRNESSTYLHNNNRKSHYSIFFLLFFHLEFISAWIRAEEMNAHRSERNLSKSKLCWRIEYDLVVGNIYMRASFFFWVCSGDRFSDVFFCYCCFYQFTVRF